MGRKRTKTIPKDEIYEIKSILSYEKRGGKDYFLVEWAGYPLSDSTWEPRSNFLDVSASIIDKLNELKESAQTKKLKQTAPKSRGTSEQSKLTSKDDSGVQRRTLTVQSELPLRDTSQSSGTPDPTPRTPVASSGHSSDEVTHQLALSNASVAAPRHGRLHTKATVRKRKDVSTGSQSLFSKKSTSILQQPSDVQQENNVSHTRESTGNLTSFAELCSPPQQTNTEASRRDGGKNRKRSKDSITTSRKENKDPAAVRKIEVSTGKPQGVVSPKKSGEPSSTTEPPTNTSCDVSKTDSHTTPFCESQVTVPQLTASSALSRNAFVSPQDTLKDNPSFVRVKSIRQDPVHGLCAIITTTFLTGIVEEFRMPISEVRVQYPDELIEFLLQRIQFRSVRPSSLTGGPQIPPSLAAA